MIRLSVIIPTLDRSRALAACLESLTIDFPEEGEVIVVDDGGREDLGPVVRPFVGPLRLTLLETSHGGPAAARNRGLAVARGDVVAFTDDDCRPRAGWLAALAAGVRTSPPHAVGGATVNGLPGNVYAETTQLVLNLLSHHDRERSGRERLLPSNNFAFPLGPLRDLGGFDESFRTAEDRDLCRRWAAAGYTLGRVPTAVVEHDSELDLAAFVRKFVDYGRGAARFHASGKDPSLRESARFHFRLPALLMPELRRRGRVRSLAIVALLALWEAANLAGYVLERRRATAPLPAKLPVNT